MKIHDVVSCSLPDWIHRFRKFTFDTEIIEIPPNVLDYLRSDSSVILPEECDFRVKNKEEEEEEEEWEERDELERPSFRNFSNLILDSLNSLGGKVFCKLNWSSPKDATWVTLDNTLLCTDLTQIYLLLKSSDFIAHDLTDPFKNCIEEDEHSIQQALLDINYYLVLRKWEDVNPGSEFRCFVKDQTIVAISQRDDVNFYSYIHKDKDTIQQDITSFFEECIKSNFNLDTYVFDVFRPAKDKVWLVDFNPFGVTTDSLLFDWEQDLRNYSPGQNIVFRYVSQETGIQPNSLRQYALPRDVIDLATGTDPHKLISLLQLQTEAEKNDLPE